MLIQLISSRSRLARVVVEPCVRQLNHILGRRGCSTVIPGYGQLAGVSVRGNDQGNSVRIVSPCLSAIVKPVFRLASALMPALLSMLTLSLFSPAVSAMMLTDVPLPHGARVEVISSNSVHNGNHLALATYESDLSLEDTAEFYRRVWADLPDEELPGMIETRTDQWLMLSRLRDGYNTVIQLSLAEPHRGRGLLSIMSLSAAKASDAQTLQSYGASIPGLQLLSSTESDDGPRSSVMSVYSSNESVEATSEHFARFLTSQKWSLVSIRDYQNNKVMLLNRSSRQIELVIGDSDDQGTIVVLNEVTNRG